MGAGSRMKAVMLILTEKCNLACRYCYECSENHEMAFDTAKKIIDDNFLANKADDFKVFFFGGEPFCKFDILRQIYYYIEEQYPNRVKKYAITTNGTLVHGYIQQWLYEQKDKFEITLSLDGTEEMHNRNRLNKSGKGSFDSIDLKFFSEAWPECVVKMTISPDTIYDFAKGIKYIEQLGFKCKANFASGVDFNIDVNKKVIQDNFAELVDYYSNNEIPLCFMLDLPLSSILIPLDEKFRYCGAGIERHCYGDNNEVWYPCQGLMPMSVEGRDEKFKFESFSDSCILMDSPCRNCKFIRICRTCYAMNYCSTKNVYHPDPQICKLNQMCILVSARIQYNRLKKKNIENKQLESAIWNIAKDLNGIFA